MNFNPELVETVRKLCNPDGIVINVNKGVKQCQLRCDYCSIAPLQDREFYQMSEREQEIQVEFIRTVLGREPTRIHFFGREPLLNLKAILKFRKLLPNQSIDITTNGVQINEKTAKILNENDLRISILSCDGPYHDAHRKFSSGEGSLKYVKRAWNLLGDYKWEMTTLRGTYLPGQDAVQYYEFQEREFGTRNVTIVPDTINSEYDPTEVAEKFIKLIDYLGGELPNSEAFIHSLPRERLQNFCQIDVFAISPDLKVYGCHHEDPAMLIGSITDGTVNQEGVNTILKHRSVNRFEMPKCRDCPANDFCPVLGQCPHSFYLATGDFSVPNSGYCNFALGFVAALMYYMSLKSKERVLEKLDQMLEHGVENFQEGDQR